MTVDFSERNGESGQLGLTLLVRGGFVPQLWCSMVHLLDCLQYRGAAGHFCDLQLEDFLTVSPDPLCPRGMLFYGLINHHKQLQKLF